MEYTRGKSLWQMRNTHLSMALVRGATEDDPSMRGAIGFSFPLFDGTDWRVPIGAQQQAAMAEWSRIVAQIPEPLQSLNDGVNYQTFESTHARQLILDSLQKLSNYITTRLEDKNLSEIAASIQLAQSDLGLMIESVKTVDRDTYNEFKRRYRQFYSDWDDGKGDEILIPSISSLYSDFRKEWDKKFWNAPKANVSAALTWFSPDEQYSNLKQDGSAIWTSYANAIGSEGQYALFGRYYNGSRKWNDTAMNYDRATGYQVGLRVLMAGSPDGGFFAEYLYDRSDRNSAGWKDERTIQIGFERKMSDGLWLQISLGSLDDGSSTDRSLFGLSFNYNIGHDRMIKPDSGS